jgi:uncharacterized protein (DUF1015 family)
VSLFEPLRGLRPAPGRAAEVAELPYDVMDRAEAVAMAAGRPHSFLHVSRPDIDLPATVPADSPAGHALAAAAFARLQEQGVLRRDEAPGFHAYRLTRAGRCQTGILGLADVAAYDAGRIRRHETTRPDKQADRAAHIEAVGAQTGPAFLIHLPSEAIRAVLAGTTAAPAPTDLVGRGSVRHELWPIDDPAQVGALVAAFEALGTLYIADGHHRSAAASMVHARRRSASSAGFLAVAFPADEVTILPYHRVVVAPDGPSAAGLLARIAERFVVEPADGPVAPAAPGRFGMYLAGRWYRLAAPEALRDPADPVAQLDVAVLQDHLLAPVLGIGDPRTDPRIGFVGGVRPLAELAAGVDSGRWTVAFALHATTVADLIGVADAGGIMPPKSTWFEPKLLDGLVSHVLD